MGQSINDDLTHKLITNNKIDVIQLEWCEKNIGEYGRDWRLMGPSQLIFLRESDSTLFALRWINK